MSKKNTNPKKKTGLRFNLIDFAILIAVVACIVGIYIRYNIEFDKINETDHLSEARVEFLILDVTEQLADALVAGSPVFSSQESKQIGELTAILQKLPAEMFVTMDDGSIIKTYSDALRYDVRGIITMKGTMTDTGFLCNGTDFIAPGATMTALTPQVDFNLLVTNITIEN